MDVDCEFPHIRALSIFPEFSLYVENGLLVNKDTHNEITRNGIIDENQLYTLCLEKDWNLGWYEIFSEFLKKF